MKDTILYNEVDSSLHDKPTYVIVIDDYQPST